MNSALAKLNPILVLRITLGLMYLYSGIDIVRHPTGWYWAIRPLPAFIQYIINNQIGIDNYLLMQGAGEILLAIFFIVWFLPRIILKSAALFSTIEIAAILLFVGIDAVTFRDIGLLGGALALFIMACSDSFPVENLVRNRQAV